VGEDLAIKELAEMISRVIGFVGEMTFDPSKPDGTPLKRLDVSKLNDLGWHASTSLKEGIRKTYEWFLTHRQHEAR
jgi:GDP-L-fucose synthase